MHGGGSKLSDLEVTPSGSLRALPVEVITTAFAFHLWIDASLRVVQVGRSLQHLAPTLTAGAPMLDSLVLLEPALAEPTLAELAARATEAVMLELRATGLRLHGRILSLSDGQADAQLVFLVEPRVRSSEQLESLGLFAGGIAHDFNNLLAALVGNTDLALLEVSPQSSIARHLREILGIAERATDLTRQLLECSGRATPELEPVSMAELVMQVRELLAGTLPSRIRLVVEQPSTALPEIHGDLGRLRQVIGDLVINGAEAISAERSGEIRLGLAAVTLTAALDEPTVRGGPIPPGSYVRVSVSDDGVGIPPALLPRIFDPFFTTKFTGRGLGLAAILGIVRGHQGALRVESTPGLGARFELYFPVRGSLPGAEPVAGVGPIPSANSGLSPRPRRPGATLPAASRLGRLLVVDDEAQVRRVLTTALVGAGFDVIAAAAGSVALELYDSDPEGFDLVLTDLTMPGLDGHELFCQLTARDPGLPVILSSGYSDHQGITCYPDGTPATFLKKPYRLGQLLAKVHEELGKRGGLLSPPRTA
jgi:two-component system, cell cycle sensor histidine kinase and response regulator CckA